MNEFLPESAKLDHTKVVAPYVRVAEIFTLDANKIYKYDIRLAQPNRDQLDAAALHTLEHLFAVTLREILPGIVDISPMGCQTGFYLIVINQQHEQVIKALVKAFEQILDYDTIPFANEIQCGNAKLHDLKQAKKYAQDMLKQKDKWA